MEKIKEKKYTVLNDAGDRITATGNEIVNGAKKKGLTGIKDKINKYFKEMYSLIEGKTEVFDRYKTDRFFENDSNKPVMKLGVIC